MVTIIVCRKIFNYNYKDLSCNCIINCSCNHYMNCYNITMV